MKIGKREEKERTGASVEIVFQGSLRICGCGSPEMGEIYLTD